MISLNDNLGGGPEQDPAPATVQKNSIKPLDTANHFSVVPQDGLVFIKGWPVRIKMTRDEALALAGWLIVTAAVTEGGLLSAVTQVKKVVDEITKPCDA